MSTITLTQNLPAKFGPHTLGPHNNAELYTKVQQTLRGVLEPISRSKPYVHTSPNLPGYLIKGKRTDSVGDQLDAACAAAGCANDLHIYRVRKAAKVQKLIEYYGLQDHVLVPKKYLFWDKDNQNWFVIAEKIDLAGDLPAIEAEYKTFLSCENTADLSEEIRRLATDQTQQRREMTAGQVRALAILAMEAGYTDTNPTNVAFTKSGKLAIIDTEPVKRAFKKIIKTSFLFKSGLCDFYGLQFQSFALSTALMRLVKMSAEAERTLSRIEHYYLAKYLVRSTVRVAALIFAWSYANMIPLIFAPFLAKVVITLSALQVAVSLMSCVYALYLSRSGFEGFLQLRQLEVGGML